VALVAIHTCRCLWVKGLPFGEEEVKMVIKILLLGNIPMAFQAISIRDRAGQRSRLRVMPADESQQVPCA
jgi:hypothetical protein